MGDLVTPHYPVACAQAQKRDASNKQAAFVQLASGDHTLLQAYHPYATESSASVARVLRLSYIPWKRVGLIVSE